MAVAAASLCDTSPPAISIACWLGGPHYARAPARANIPFSCAAGYRLYIKQGDSVATLPTYAKAGLSMSLTCELANPQILRSL